MKKKLTLAVLLLAVIGGLLYITQNIVRLKS